MIRPLSLRSRHESGITLIALIGVLAVITVGLSMAAPSFVQMWDQHDEEAEIQHLRRIADGILLYLEQEKTFPPSLTNLAPDYLPFPSAQLTQNKRGYSRYYFVHPTMNSFNDAIGLTSSQLPDARVLLISNLTRDESPTITNATEFETWWATDESATPGLHIHRTNAGFLFHLLTINQDGNGGSYQLNGTGTDSGGNALALHSNYHLTGTTIQFDEADFYVSPEVQFALTTNTAYWYDPLCTVKKQWNPLAPDCGAGATLWLTTFGSTTGTPGITWTDSELVAFDIPNLTYESGPTSVTSGIFSQTFDIENFTATADLDAVHYVGTALTTGGISLTAGDLLLSTMVSETLTSDNSLSVTNKDIFSFRPTTPGNYSSGIFTLIIDGGDMGLVDIQSITLVEKQTVVGGTTLAQGSFLWADSSQDVYEFVPTSLGNTTSGTATIFIDGSDINISADNFFGLELIESGTTVGDVTLTTGQILATLAGNDISVGDNSIATKRQDIFILDLTSTGTTTTGNATLFFDGSDVSMGSVNETVDGIATRILASPPPSGGLNNVKDNFNAIAYNGNDGTENYTNDWQEIGESDGPQNGIVEVSGGGGDCVSGKCIEWRANDDEDFNGMGLSREADLTGKTTATLIFSYRRARVDGPPDPGSITLAVSSNGGASWTDLQTYVMTAEDGGQVPQSFDITPYMASNTQIRFMGTVSNVDRVQFYVDNIEIAAN